eukprot:gene10492-11592_t
MTVEKCRKTLAEKEEEFEMTSSEFSALKIDHAEIVRANEEKLSELERHEEVSNDVSTSTLSSDEQNSNGMKFREELSKFVENINAKYQNTYLDKCVNCRVCIAGQVPY